MWCEKLSFEVVQQFALSPLLQTGTEHFYEVVKMSLVLGFHDAIEQSTCRSPVSFFGLLNALRDDALCFVVNTLFRHLEQRLEGEQKCNSYTYISYVHI